MIILKFRFFVIDHIVSTFAMWNGEGVLIYDWKCLILPLPSVKTVEGLGSLAQLNRAIAF